MRVDVHMNRGSGSYHCGGFSSRIEAAPAPAFSGPPSEAAAFLRGLPLGVSVETRRYDDSGRFLGLRSCMNKPALWADVETVSPEA